MELDTLADELHYLTDHGVLRDANFSKFGHDAHIRTKIPIHPLARAASAETSHLSTRSESGMPNAKKDKPTNFTRSRP